MPDKKHYAYQHYVYFGEDGCLHIKDEYLIQEIKERWDEASDVCIKLDNGGGGEKPNTMCSCRKPSK